MILISGRFEICRETAGELKTRRIAKLSVGMTMVSGEFEVSSSSIEIDRNAEIPHSPNRVVALRLGAILISGKSVIASSIESIFRWAWARQPG
jgi:hypothetical protein